MKFIYTNRENLKRFIGTEVLINFKGINYPLCIKTKGFITTTSKVIKNEIQNNFMVFITENYYYVFEK